MNPEDLLTVYEWVDTIPLSKKKKNINRDFCDGMLTAEILKFYYPKLVDVHNYPETLNTAQKIDNWSTLCTKVFKKIGFSMSAQEIDDVIHCKPKAIEGVLWRLYNLIVKKKKIKVSGGVGKMEDSKIEVNNRMYQNHKNNNIIQNLEQENSVLKSELDLAKAYSASLEKRIEEYKNKDEYSHLIVNKNE